MAQVDTQELVQRIERLERRNRLLAIACMAMPLLAIVGWQNAPQSIRAKRLEIVNDQGVPLVTLEPSRTGEGGSVVLRDAQGEKRSWWEVGPERGNFTLSSAKPDGSNDTTLGLQVGEKNARMSIVSKNGALLSASMDEDQPLVEMYGQKGNVLFQAPWKPVKKGD